MKEVNSFIEYLQFERRYSKHTLVAYENDLNQFLVFTIETYESPTLLEINSGIVRSWLVSLMDSGITSRTVNRKITALKSFFRYAIKSNWIKTNPMSKISSPKISKRLPEYIEAVKLDLLLDKAEFSDDFNGVRDHLIIELFYGTGMRLSELLGLKISDVNLRSHQLKVTGKRNKQRIIPLFEKLENNLRSYLIQRNDLASDSLALFIFENGSELYPVYVYRLVNKYLSQVSTRKKKSPHVLRHSFATEMLNKGADLNAIKELLGHANLSATQVYTHNTIEKLKAAYLQAHPRA
ncbi:MAG: tyrosine-type recombinase/integrase [Bacteroidia bacterium]